MQFTEDMIAYPSWFWHDAKDEYCKPSSWFVSLVPFSCFWTYYNAVRKSSNTNYLYGTLVLWSKWCGRGILLKWMSTGPGSEKKAWWGYASSSCRIKQQQGNKKPERGSAVQKAACMQGNAGVDVVWNWSFMFQGVQTLHIRKYKLEFKCCGIQ